MPNLAPVCKRGVPCDDLPTVLTGLLTEHFGAQPLTRSVDADRNGHVQITVDE